MKTNLRLALVGVGLVGMMVCVGCADRSANAEDVPTVTANPPPPPKPTEPAAVPPVSLEAPTPTEEKSTNAPLPQPGTNAVGAAITPETINPSPALAEVIRLLQAGVSEEVVMAYVTNSVEPFGIGSNEILYLHDLGAPPTIITTLIQHDALPEVVARKQAASAVKPLPPGVALNTPATNLLPKAPAQAANNPPEPAPVNPPTDTAVAPVPVATDPVQTVAYPEPVEQPVSTSYFYTSLAPYGGWVDVPGYGHCWRPTVAVWNSSWRPYADGGRWLWTDRGWYWYSDYSWGWAPFHYGRWTCPTGIGWVWQPDVHWGPAWVSWRYSSSHCGWAPLPPSARFVFGHGFRHNGISVGINFDFGIHDDHYVFVPTSRFCDRRPLSHSLTRTHARSVYRESTVVNNYVTVNNTTVVNRGVGLDRVANVTRGGVRQVSLRRTSDASGTGTVRREVLGTDGTTLTVANPAAPIRPVSGSPTVRGRSQRDGSATTGSSFAGGSPGSATATPASGSPTDSSRISPNRAGTVPSAALPQQRNFRTSPSASGRGALRGGDSDVRIAGGQSTPPTPTTGLGSGANAGSSAGATPSAINNDSRSLRPSPATGNSSRQTAYRQTIANPSAPSTPAPNASPAARSVPGRTETRPESNRRSVEAPATRSPIARSSEVITPRYNSPAPSAPSAPIARPSAPVAPSRSESYRSSSPAPAPSRSESYRPSAPTPAPSRSESYRSSSPSPAPRESAPARSSEGSSRSSRSSDDGNGRRGR